MRESAPSWWSRLPEDERPFLVGYARADGIADPVRTRLLRDLGVRQVMIGMDAGSAVSLAAMNKPLRSLTRPVVADAETLYQQNHDALQVARNEGMLIRAGFVIGHIGLTPGLLKENVEMIMSLIQSGASVISALDIEVLSPQPGSLDFQYLTDPLAARAAAARVGLEVGDDRELRLVADRWKDEHIVLPEEAMRDYAAALMPGIEFTELMDARARIRTFARECGGVIGEATEEAARQPRIDGAASPLAPV